MSRICQIILVCEGWRDSAFARGFLNENLRCRGRIEPRTNPGGSGHDWVKDQLVEEIANLQKYREGRGVIALLDEDGKGVEQHRKEVSTRLMERKLPGLDAAEGRCLLLPARNVETWLYWLESRRQNSNLFVNEIEDYKKARPPEAGFRIGDEHCKSAGAYLHGMDHTQVPESCPPLLGEALAELRAFLRALK